MEMVNFLHIGAHAILIENVTKISYPSSMAELYLSNYFVLPINQ